MSDFAFREEAMSVRKWAHFKSSEYFRLDDVTQGNFERMCIDESANKPALYHVRISIAQKDASEEPDCERMQTHKGTILYEGPVRDFSSLNMQHLLVVERTHYSPTALQKRIAIPEGSGIVGLVTTSPDGDLCVVDCKRSEYGLPTREAGFLYPELYDRVVLDITQERYCSFLIAQENSQLRVIIEKIQEKDLHPPAVTKRLLEYCAGIARWFK